MKSRRKRIGWLVGFTILVLVAAYAVIQIVYESPRARLERGISNLNKELGVWEPSSFCIDVTVTLPQMEKWNRFEITLDGGIDCENQLADMDVTLGMFYFQLAEGRLAIQQQDIYVRLSEILDDTYRYRLEQLDIWAWQEAFVAFRNRLTTFSDESIVEPLDEKKELEIEGERQACEGLRLSLEEEDFIDFYLDSKGNIVYMEIASSIAGDDDYRIEARGSLTEMVTGESLLLDVKTMSVFCDGTPILRIAGDIMLENDEKEIKIPEEAVNFQGLSQEEVMALWEKIEESLQGVVGFS